MNTPRNTSPECLLVGGCPSSGTTLVRSILDAHPSICCGPELGIFDRLFVFQHSFSRFRAYMHVSEEIMDRRFRVRGNDFFAVNILADILNASSPLGTKINFSFQGSSNGCHYYESNKEVLALAIKANDYPEFFKMFFLGPDPSESSPKIWAEKTPENILFVNESLALLPGSVFLSVLRHPLDLLASLINRSRNRFNPVRAMQHCLACLRARSKSVNNPQCVEVVYEHLVARPGETIATLMRAIGLNPDPAQLSFFKQERVGTGGYATEPIHTKSVGRWERDLDAGLISHFVDLLAADVPDIIDYYEIARNDRLLHH